MATHRIPILGWATRPDDTGDCYLEPMDIRATNDVWDRMLFVFGAAAAAAPTVRAGVHGSFTVPKNYVGSAVLVIVWTATVTTNVVVWDFEYRAVGGSDTESLDQSGTQESVTASTTTGTPSAAWERMETTISLTSGNFAVDDEVLFFFGRDGADAADTKAGSGLLFNLLFQYADVQMVYRLHAELRFSLSTVRASALAQIGSTGTASVTLKGSPSLIVDRVSATQAGIQSVYATIAALGTPLALSMVAWHPCYHGEAGPVCTPSALKRW